MISKKELLLKMNISYGQLYRWKRENLIPDEWFQKVSVPSGQETYFDEALIIPRIEKILELKEKYSLEELQHMFNDINQACESEEKPKLSKSIIYEIIDISILNDCKQYLDDLSIYQVSIMYAFTQILSEYPNAKIKKFIDYLMNQNITNPKELVLFVQFTKDDISTVVLCKKPAMIYSDENYYDLDIDDLNNEVWQLLKKGGHF